MLTYQQIKEFLEKLSGLFAKMQSLQDAQAQVTLLSNDLAHTCDFLQADRSHMTDEIQRTEKIGELIRKCVYEASEHPASPGEQQPDDSAPDSLLRQLRRDELK